MNSADSPPSQSELKQYPSEDSKPPHPNPWPTRLRRWFLRPLGYLLWYLFAVILTVLGVGSLIPGFIIALSIVGIIVFRQRLQRAFAISLALCVIITVWRSSLKPSNDRIWQPDVAVMALPKLQGNTIEIAGVRNFRWSNSGTVINQEKWETRRYDLGKLQGVDLIVEPFVYSELMAHTMLSFDFGTDGRILLSIEARKEIGETYQPILGGLNHFELIYLFIDERDALSVRAQKHHQLYAYPLKINPLHLRAFFLSLCTTADNLRDNPTFYHIIRHNCTTVWIEQADALSSRPVGLRWQSIANGLIAELVFDRGLIDTDLEYPEAKRKFQIDAAVLNTNLDSPDFSEIIRNR